MYHGLQGPNAILRGETKVQEGDTFLSKSIDHMGFASFRYQPKTPEPEKPYMHFKLLATGLRAKCEAAAKK